MHSRNFWVLLLWILAATMAHADVGLVLEQSIGRQGLLTGTGHVAIYLSRICAESPTHLRRCKPGEHGVIISRYNRADRYDWTAIPLVPYLYAVEQPEDIPASMDAATLERLRNRYRQEHLRNLLPEDSDGKVIYKHWIQLVGSAYDRRIHVFEVPTTAAQDDRMIQYLNARVAKGHFNLLFRNCANFAGSILNFYFPHSIHRSFTADLGLMTPKQTAKSFVSYARHHENVKLSVFTIPQIPGKIHRSGKQYGIVEALVKKKQYLIPLAIWQPYFTVALIGTYLTRGRFNPNKNSILLTRNNDIAALSQDAVPSPNGQNEKNLVENVPFNLLGSGDAQDCLTYSACSLELSHVAPEDMYVEQFSSERLATP